MAAFSENFDFPGELLAIMIVLKGRIFDNNMTVGLRTLA
jgi:hypothetical protein